VCSTCTLSQCSDSAILLVLNHTSKINIQERLRKQPSCSVARLGHSCMAKGLGGPSAVSAKTATGHCPHCPLLGYAL